MAREYLTLDLSSYPLVIGTFQDFIPTAEEFSGWQTMMDAFNQERDNYVMFLDFSKVKVFSIEHRLLAAKWARKNDKLFMTKNLSVVFYTPSTATRILMKTIIAMSRPKSKYVIVSNFDKGLAIARRLVAENKVKA